MFLSSARVPKASVALRAERDVRVAAEASLLHVAVADLEIDEDLVNPLQIGRRLFSAPDVRFADDLDQRHAGPVQIDVAHGVVLVVHQFPRVLLHMDPRNPDSLLSAVELHLDPAVFGGGLSVLGDLVAFGKVGIEVVLPGETALPVDPAVRRQGHLHHELHDLPVEHGKHPGHPEADGAGVGVGRRPEFRRAAAEDLRIREELGMDLQPDDRFEFHYSPGSPFFDLCLFLVGRGELDEPPLLEMARQELHPDGESGGGEAAGDGDPRDPGQVGRDREDVGEVHLHGIVGLSRRS